MGIETMSDGVLFWGDVPIARGEIQLSEITVPADAPELEITPLLEPMEFTVTIKTPKRWRCRSRKRFIKLMMSEGLTRNYAEKLANFTRMLMPYGQAWRVYLLFAKQYRG